MRISEIELSTATKKDTSDRYDLDEYINVAEPTSNSIKGYPIYFNKTGYSGEAEHSYLIKDPDDDGFLGVLQLTMSQRNKFWYSQVFFDPEIQGKGLAVPLYKLAIDEGYTIVSDKSQTKGSRTLWAKLAGLPGVHVYAWNMDTKQFFSWDPEESPEEEIYRDNATIQKAKDDINKQYDVYAKAYKSGEISKDEFSRLAKKMDAEIDSLDPGGATGSANNIRLVATKD